MVACLTTVYSHQQQAQPQETQQALVQIVHSLQLYWSRVRLKRFPHLDSLDFTALDPRTSPPPLS